LSGGVGVGGGAAVGPRRDLEILSTWPQRLPLSISLGKGGGGGCLQHAHAPVEHDVEGEERCEGLPVQRKPPLWRGWRGALARHLRRLLRGGSRLAGKSKRDWDSL
jgi:hypothetical protein